MPVRARLAGFQLEQEAVAVVLDGAQLVEFGVEPVGDHAAVAHQRRGLFEDGARPAAARNRRAAPVPSAICASREARPCRRWRELRRLVQRLPQAHQLARAHLAQRDARGDALDVAAALEFGAQRLPQASRAAAAMASSRSCASRALAPRLQQPALEHAAAHARHAGVEQREQRGRVLAAQGLHQFQVAPGRDGQLDQLVVALRPAGFCTWESARPCVCSA